MTPIEKRLKIRARAQANYEAYTKMAHFTFEDFRKLLSSEEGGDELKWTSETVTNGLFESYASMLDELNFDLRLRALEEAKKYVGEADDECDIDSP